MVDRRFEAHLRACPNCTAYVERIRMTIILRGSIDPEELTPEAKQELDDLYRRWRISPTGPAGAQDGRGDL